MTLKGRVEVMWFMLIGFLVIVIGLVGFVVGQYNKLVRHDNYVKTAWSNIDNQLDAKARILTNVIQVLEMGYEKEKEFIQAAVLARQGLQNGNVAEKAKMNDVVQNQLLPQMNILAEAYPNSNASAALGEAMEKIAACEDKITYARTGYNKQVEMFNILIKTFPTVILAGMFGYATPKELFEITQEERKSFNRLSVNDIRNSKGE